MIPASLALLVMVPKLIVVPVPVWPVDACQVTVAPFEPETVNCAGDPEQMV